MLLLNILHNKTDTHFLLLIFNSRSVSNALPLPLEITTSFLVTLEGFCLHYANIRDFLDLCWQIYLFLSMIVLNRASKFQ